MNCTNCGAPMQLFERRRYFYCKHCGTFQFLDAPDLDGVQVLAAVDAGSCSICNAGLARALLDGLHPIRYCQRCRGVLMPRPTFGEVMGRRRAWASEPSVPPAPIDRAELERRVACPSCAARMEVHPYYGPGNVVIDTCAACDLIWLDFGELKQIVAAPGRDRGRRDTAAPHTATTAGLPPASAAEASPSDEGSQDGANYVDLLEVVSRLFSRS